MKRYLALILLEGATVMAVELSGAKLLAPLYGTSLYVWASILAITLGALALGYFFGGVLSSKHNLQTALFKVITIACVLIAAMPFISFYVLPYISYLPFSLAVILSSIILIFAPIFLLGCTSPLFIRLNVDTVETIGLVSGKVYAISTVGGIFSTFLCGFIFIPYLGLKYTLVLFSIALFICAVLTLKTIKFNSLISLILAVLSAFYSKAHSNATLLSKNGVMGEIEVIDTKTDSLHVRRLLINQIVQTEMDVKTKQSVTKYTQILDSIVKPTVSGNALLLGLGGGLVANMLINKKYNVDGVEFDPRIIQAAKTHFFLNEKTKVYCQDGRYFINKTSKLYDVIIIDVFKGEEQPSHVITIESIQKMKSVLAENGQIIINWHGYITLPTGLGTQILINTFKKLNFKMALISTGTNEDFSNTVLVFTKSNTSSGFNTNMPINTDDLPILEAENAQANLKWRKNYLRYYQGTNKYK